VPDHQPSLSLKGNEVRGATPSELHGVVREHDARAFAHGAWESEEEHSERRTRAPHTTRSEPTGGGQVAKRAMCEWRDSECAALIICTHIL